MKKKRMLFASVIALATISIPTGIIYTFNKPTKLNKYIASNLYKEPANSNFSDDNFYACVVDSYNQELGASRPYTYSLNNTQLALISSVVCKTNVEDISGVEKLVNLEELSLYSNDLEEISLEQNTNLIGLSLWNSKVEELDLTNNSKLTYLNLYYNSNLTSVKTAKFINLTTNTKLKELVYGQSEKTINVSDDYDWYPNESIRVYQDTDASELISGLNLDGLTGRVYNGIAEVTSGNVEDNYRLKIFDGDTVIQDIKIEVFINDYFKEEKFSQAVLKAYNDENSTNLSSLTETQLASIEKLESTSVIKDITGIEKLTGLKELVLDSNIIDENTIDLSENTELEKVWLKNTVISKTLANSLINNQNITSLYIKNTDLGTINLSNNNNLVEVGLSTNASTINLSSNTNLEALYITNAPNIKTIDLSNNTNLTKLTLNNLPKLNSIDLSENVNLEELDLKNNDLKTIDLTNNTELTNLAITGNPKLQQDYVMLVGENKSVKNDNIKMPSNITPTYEVGASGVLTYDSSTNKVTATNVGTTTITIKYNLGNESYINSNVSVYKMTTENENITINAADGIILAEGVSPIDIIKDLTFEGCVARIKDNTLQLISNNKVVRTLKLVGYYSYIYDMMQENIVINGTYDETNIKLMNTTLTKDGKHLTIKYEGNSIKEYDYYEIEIKDLNVVRNRIYAYVLLKQSDYVYNTFVTKFNMKDSGLTFKVFNAHDEEVTDNEDLIIDQYSVKLYKNSQLIYTYTISEPLAYASEQLMPTIEFITEITQGESIAEALSVISSRVLEAGFIKVYDKDGNELDLTDQAATGQIVKIRLSDNKVFEYTLVVKGDTNGDGYINISDLTKVITVIKQVIKDQNIEDLEEVANDLNKDGFINISDLTSMIRLISELLG